MVSYYPCFTSLKMSIGFNHWLLFCVLCAGFTFFNMRKTRLCSSTAQIQRCTSFLAAAAHSEGCGTRRTLFRKQQSQYLRWRASGNVKLSNVAIRRVHKTARITLQCCIIATITPWPHLGVGHAHTSPLSQDPHDSQTSKQIQHMSCENQRLYMHSTNQDKKKSMTHLCMRCGSKKPCETWALSWTVGTGLSTDPILVALYTNTDLE